MRFFLFFLFLIASILSVVGSAIAEQSLSVPDREAAFAEMENFYQWCLREQTIREPYDCRCLSVKYFDAIKDKTAIVRSEIVEGLDKSGCERTEETDLQEELKDIPDEYFREAEAFYERCQTNWTYQTHYDCECLQNAYLDERISQGKLAAPSAIEFMLQKTCFDEVSIAGFGYERCLSRGVRLPADLDEEEYCGCFARKYARGFVEAGSGFNSRLRTYLTSTAQILCKQELRSERGRF